MSKSRLANDPLDAMFSEPMESPGQKTSVQKESVSGRFTPTEAKKQKVRVTVLVDSEVAEKARDVVFFTPGETLASFAERALTKAIEESEKDRGEAFPKRHSNLPLGRPVS